MFGGAPFCKHMFLIIGDVQYGAEGHSFPRPAALAHGVKDCFCPNLVSNRHKIQSWCTQLELHQGVYGETQVLLSPMFIRGNREAPIIIEILHTISFQ